MVGTDNSIERIMELTCELTYENLMKNMFSRDMATPPGSDATRLTITLRDFSVI